jgi:hypothetical protein
MALSLDSIYKPVNDFFLNRFQTGEGSPVVFKFDKIGVTIDDQDFIDPAFPDNTVFAQESFSDLVNRLPVESPDGVNIIFTPSEIDKLYFSRILNACIPFGPADNPNREDMINSASRIISNAKRQWEQLSLARSRGIADFYRASFSTPAKWYDKNNNDIWTNHSFQVTETTTTTPASDDPKLQVWRLRLDEAVIQQMLSVEHVEHTDQKTKSVDLDNKILLKATDILQQPLTIAGNTANNISNANVALGAGRINAAAVLNVAVLRNAPVQHAEVSPQVAAVAVHPDYTLPLDVLQTSSKLEFKEKIALTAYIKENAPTQQVTTNSISISFDYCIVNIRRPWLEEAFLSSNNWYVPGLTKAQLNTSGTTGNLPVLPVGFIAIRNLNIEAQWTDQDMVNSRNATDFGPFEVRFNSMTNKLSHDGIQIIGWMLQKMPDLPPNNPPQ